jgi:hypothetical protein
MPKRAGTDPAAGGGDAVGEAQDPVGGPREALGVGVADQEDERQRGQRQTQRVQQGSGHQHQRRPGGREQPQLPHAEHAARQMTAGGARVAGVDPAIDHAVGRHRACAGADHGGGDPAHGPGARPAAGGQEHGDVGERQREDRVLELDGVEQVPELAQSP